MAKKKGEKLTPVPKPRARQESAAAGRKGKGQESQEAAPDLSYIAEGLRPLAVPCSEVSFDPANARLHGEESIEALKASLRVYGQRRPIVVNKRTGHVEAGNGLLAAALSLGYTHLAVLYVTDSDSQAAGYALADNRTAELSSWDDKALTQLLEDLDTANDPVLDKMIADLAEAEKLIPVDPAPAKAPKWEIVVSCSTEEERDGLLTRLQGEGLSCKARGKTTTETPAESTPESLMGEFSDLPVDAIGQQ